MKELVRYSEQNQNVEALKGKYGVEGEEWGCVTCIKNVVFVIAYKGAKVVDYVLPEVYDGFLICSDGTTIPVENSRLSLDLGSTVSAQGSLQLRAVN